MYNLNTMNLDYTSLYKDTWQKVLQLLTTQPNFDMNMYDMYLTNSEMVSFKKPDNIITIAVDDFISKTYFEMNKDLIIHLFRPLLDVDKFEIIFDDRSVNNLSRLSISKTKGSLLTQIPEIKTAFEKNQTFSSFVLGKSNNQAHVASIGVATNPGVMYNPLYIHGNSGLGKTHLLNAIANKVLEDFPSKIVGYISSQNFVDCIVSYSKTNSLDIFKKAFLELDVLLVDDIQFIANKEKTHEIFFAIFNELINSKKQICLTSDRKPNEIEGLQERLISRFYQGLTIEIQTPEFETSFQILKSKLSQDSKDISNDALSYIAKYFSKDVRQLEGALNRLMFYAINFHKGEEIGLDIAIEAFKDDISKDCSKLNFDKIIRVVTSYYNLTKAQLVSKSRSKPIAYARHVAIYLTRKHLDYSYPEIASEFKRDHSTIMSSYEKIEELIKIDLNMKQAIDELERKLL